MQFEFTSQLWEYHGKASWHFVTLPPQFADDIKFFQPSRVGFGSVRVTVKIGDSQWQTSLFPDKASASYLLPIKADIRKKNHIIAGDMVNIHIAIDI